MQICFQWSEVSIEWKEAGMVNKHHIYHGIVKNSQSQVVYSEVLQTHSWSQVTLEAWISFHLLLLCLTTLQANEFRSDIIHRIIII